MTLQEFKAGHELETGVKMSNAVASVLFDRFLEAEYQRKASGAYDLIPEEQPVPRHAVYCFEAMDRGSDCLCGLVNHDAEIEMHESSLMYVAPKPEPEDDGIPW